jgi:hypothetical protein
MADKAARDRAIKYGSILVRNGPPWVRRGVHKPDPPPCALCDGYGDVVNPGNADPAVKVTDWLPPVGCPRCGQTGKDPNP